MSTKRNSILAGLSILAIVSIWLYLLHTLPGTMQIPGPVNNISFSSNGTLLMAVTSEGHHVFLRHLRDRRNFFLPRSDGLVLSATFSPDCKTIAYSTSSPSSGKDRSDRITLFDLQKNLVFETFSVAQGQIRTLKYSPDGKLLALGGIGVSFYGLAAHQKMRIQENSSKESVMSLAFSPDGKFLATTNYSGSISLIEVSTNNLISTIKPVGNQFHSIAFSSDGKCLASVADKVCLWSLSTGKLMSEIRTTSPARTVAFSSKGSVLAVGSLNGSVEFINVDKGVIIASLRNKSSELSSIAWSPDDQTIAFGNISGVIFVSQTPDLVRSHISQ